MKSGDLTCLVAARAIAHPVNLDNVARTLASYSARIRKVWFGLLDPNWQRCVENDVGDGNTICGYPQNTVGDAALPILQIISGLQT
jgi:hypothetical protein